ncbi:MAG: hypothetical protein WCK55_16670 [Verrucomicrobiota bacterium]
MARSHSATASRRQPPEDLLRHAALAADEDEERNELREMLNKRYAAQRHTNFTEVSSYVFDTARELMRRSEIFDATKLSVKDQDRYGRTA